MYIIITIIIIVIIIVIIVIIIIYYYYIVNINIWFTRVVPTQTRMYLNVFMVFFKIFYS